MRKQGFPADNRRYEKLLLAQAEDGYNIYLYEFEDSILPDREYHFHTQEQALDFGEKQGLGRHGWQEIEPAAEGAVPYVEFAARLVETTQNGYPEEKWQICVGEDHWVDWDFPESNRL